MRRPRFSVRSSDPRSGGFTLTEILVGLTIASVIIGGVGTGFVWESRAWTDHQARIQTQQSLRAAIETLNREVRLAGACMPAATLPPIANNYQPLSGAGSGTTQSITVTSNPACAGPASLSAACNACNVINVQLTTNFTAGKWAYIYNSSTQTNPAGPYGQFFLIQSVAAGSPGTITASPLTPITNTYPGPSNGVALSSVWGADQRTFAISSTCSGCNGVPTLTLQMLGGAAQPLVKGIDAMSFQYVLNRLYSTNPAECNGQTGGTSSLCVVNLPTQAPSVAGDWQLVRDVTATLDARSAVTVRATGSPDHYLHLAETIEISPRNYIYQQNRVPWTPY